MAALIKELTGVQYHPGHVWRLLGDHGFSCQRRERRAIGRDGTRFGPWKRVERPAVKRSPCGSPNHRLHRRKRTEQPLPADAPESDPLEYMWGDPKQHQIGNLIATQAWEIGSAATATFRG